jgi:hypothetical protein
MSKKRTVTKDQSPRKVEETVIANPQPTDGLPVPSRLEKAISELQGLHELLQSGDLDPLVLTDFRDALNRVRTAAWAAQQYVVRKETEQDSSSVLSFLVGEKIRVTHQLCQGLGDDLKRADVTLQAGTDRSNKITLGRSWSAFTIASSRFPASPHTIHPACSTPFLVPAA